MSAAARMGGGDDDVPRIDYGNTPTAPLSEHKYTSVSRSIASMPRLAESPVLFLPARDGAWLISHQRLLRARWLSAISRYASMLFIERAAARFRRRLMRPVILPSLSHDVCSLPLVYRFAIFRRRGHFRFHIYLVIASA